MEFGFNRFPDTLVVPRDPTQTTPNEGLMSLHDKPNANEADGSWEDTDVIGNNCGDGV